MKTLLWEWLFYHLNDQKCAASYNATTSPALILFKLFDDPVNVYTGPLFEENIINFLKAESIPAIVEFSEEYSFFLAEEKTPALILFVSDSDREQPFVKVFEEAARSLKNEIMFVKSGVLEGI